MQESNKKRKNQSTEISSYKLNKENPFLLDAINKIEKSTVKTYKTASKTGEKAILKAYDESTGKVLGYTTFIRQVEVDEDQFAKIYLSNFSAFFELNPQAIKVFGYILTQLIPNRDEFIFLIDDCLEYTRYKSETSIRLGLTSLLKNEIIARGRADNLFYINPMIVFNGNRVTFAQTFIKKKIEDDSRLLRQDDLSSSTPENFKNNRYP